MFFGTSGSTGVPLSHLFLVFSDFDGITMDQWSLVHLENLTAAAAAALLHYPHQLVFYNNKRVM